MSAQGKRKLSSGQDIILASHNMGKLQEFQTLLKETGIIVHSAASFKLEEPEETGTSFEENAAIKALAAAKQTGLPALSDDSGFCVEALEGRPGIYSARWAGENRDMELAMARVYAEMQASENPSKKSCFKVVLCLAWPDGETHFIAASCEGEVAWPPKGAHGHGYDPIFIPKGETRRFAEMTEQEKNRFSHRGKAMEIFLKECVE